MILFGWLSSIYTSYFYFNVIREDLGCGLTKDPGPNLGNVVWGCWSVNFPKSNKEYLSNDETWWAKFAECRNWTKAFEQKYEILYFLHIFNPPLKLCPWKCFCHQLPSAWFYVSRWQKVLMSSHNIDPFWNEAVGPRTVMNTIHYKWIAPKQCIGYWTAAEKCALPLKEDSKCIRWNK